MDAAHWDAWRSIQQQLLDGTLPVRTSDPESFFLRFDAPSLGREWPLLEGNQIPREFWLHYFETFGRARRDSTSGLPLGEADEANASRSAFWFISRTGWKENGVLQGEVRGVEIHRPSILGLSKRHGERSEAYGGTDKVAVSEILRRTEAGEDRGQVITEIASRSDFPGANVEAKKRRLRGKVSAALSGKKTSASLVRRSAE